MEMSNIKWKISNMMTKTNNMLQKLLVEEVVYKWKWLGAAIEHLKTGIWQKKPSQNHKATGDIKVHKKNWPPKKVSKIRAVPSS